MSKKFHDDDRTLEVQENGGKINLYIEGKINELGVEIAPSDAPALALAILEAAGAHKDSQDFLGGAVEQLKFHIGEQKRITAEAEAQAELEAEALELFNQYRIATQLEPIDSWAEAHPLAKEQWLAVARRAREMRAEK